MHLAATRTLQSQRKLFADTLTRAIEEHVLTLNTLQQ